MADFLAEPSPASSASGSRESAETSAAPRAPAERVSPRMVDVWTRTEPRYRRRAAFLLTFNVLLFCGLCVFTHWLHVGRLFDFSWQAYAEPARFWGEQTRTLYDFILFPISVEQTPIHGVVLGLLLASIVAVPIITAILYRIPAALPFAAAVAVFAHMPWMAVTLVLCCTLAGWRKIRMNFRFGSALLGMLPAILYIYLALRGGPEIIGTSASPAQKTQLMAPWVLAILAACAMMGVTLLIAHLVNYRPGAITPVITIMFATPVVLFHSYVGTDELAYRVLEADYGPRAPRFSSVQDAAVVEERILAMFQRWAHPDNPGFRDDLMATLGGDVRRFPDRVRRRFALDFLTDRSAAYEAFKLFLAQHPRSRYVANVLYMQARALDTRLDERALSAQPPRVELYNDFAHLQSEAVWSTLWSEANGSNLATAAGVRLAHHHLRRGEVDEALDKLNAVLRRANGPAAPAAATQSTVGALLTTPPPEASLEFEQEPYRAEAARMVELLAANRDDPKFGNAPLADYFALDGHRPRYGDELLRLSERYRDSKLWDNLIVAWAASLPDAADRAEKLLACATRFETGDALPEALFRLADLEIQSLGGRDESTRAAGLARMRTVADRFGDTIWGRQAAERMSMLKSAMVRASEGTSSP